MEKIQTWLRFTDYSSLMLEVYWHIFWENKDSKLKDYIWFTWINLPKKYDYEMAKQCFLENLSFDSFLELAYKNSYDIFNIMKAQTDEYFTNEYIIPIIPDNISSSLKTYMIWGLDYDFGELKIIE